MRIHLLTGGLLLLAAMPVAAQEAADSTDVFAVPSSTPAAPNAQVILDRVAEIAARVFARDSSVPDAAGGMAVVVAGAVVLFSLRCGRGWSTGGDGAGVLRF